MIEINDEQYRWCRRCREPQPACRCGEARALEGLSPRQKLLAGASRLALWELTTIRRERPNFPHPRIPEAEANEGSMTDTDADLDTLPDEYPKFLAAAVFNCMKRLGGDAVLVDEDNHMRELRMVRVDDVALSARFDTMPSSPMSHSAA